MRSILLAFAASLPLSLIGGLAPGAPQAAAQTRVGVLVVDASGSMWNRMGGDITRIEVAREVIGEYFAARTAQVPLSVIAYGHNRRGDCTDIEVIAPMGSHAPGALAARINGLTPRGMTPLAESLRAAARQIPATAEAADIILVTDGLETCEGDPCAVAAELAAQGIDIRAHVVGFGLTREEVNSLACVPELTGGKLFQTNSGAELAAALAVVEAPAPAEMTFRAVDARNGRPLGPVDWVVSGANGTELTRASGVERLTATLEEGSWRIAASLPGYAGALELAAEPGMTGSRDVPLDKILATLTLRAVDAETWAPVRAVDWVLINVATEESASLSAGESIAVLLPPGDYRIEGESEGRTGGVLAEAVLEQDREAVVELALALPEASISGPSEVTVGAGFEVDWTGPAGAGDYVTIVAAGSDEGAYDSYANAAGGSPAMLRAPSRPGTYELRYYHRDLSRTLARAPITVADATASLDAPDLAVIGAPVAVGWTGPDGEGDYVTIVEPGAPEGAYTGYDYTRAGSPVTVTMPATPGTYELRYVLGTGDRTLARRPIEVVEAMASVSGPAEAVAGSVIEVVWQGPDNPNDYITVVEAGAPEGAYNDYFRTRQGTPAKVTLPDGLGAYEVRYVLHQSGRTLASAPLRLVAATASVSGPAEAVAGSVIEVVWQGPNNPNDYITVVEAGAPEGSYNDYFRTRQGTPAKVTLPDGLGAYEVRYVLHQSGRTLASAPLRLVAATASVSGPAEAVAGSVIEVVWEGPNNPNDYITVVEAGAPEGSYNDYFRTRQGTPAKVTLPDGLGAYEVRYVLHQSGRTLASAPLRLVAATASVSVDGPIVPGGNFEVRWEGPNNPNDYITIVPAGAPENSYEDYWRTRQGSPARLKAPESGGAYEVRYVLHQSRRVLAALPVEVGAGDVTLALEGEATAGGVVTVTFTGPGRFVDMIQIVPEGAADDAPALREARASQGSPLQVFAPASAGMYELRYRATDSGDVLARVPLEVR